MKPFMNENFLLENDTAIKLYHDYAADMPIFDYHCHLPPQQIAEDKQFKNLTEIWLYGDHYKWRAMRTNGTAERYCTGDATDKEKFDKWAETVPHTLRNPLYHWTHLELRRYFDEQRLLSPSTATEIYESVSQKVASPDFSARSLMIKMNVKAVCTTDDPIDNLEHHQKIKADNFSVKVLPTFRPDKAMACENIEVYNNYLDQLADVSATSIKSFDDLVSAVDSRHAYFHENGCRLSDHGLETAYAEDYTQREVDKIFKKVRARKQVSVLEGLKLKSALFYEFGKMNHKRGWVQQLHLGALRNNNSRLYRSLGPDTGFDSILDIDIARPLSKFLSKLDDTNELSKTIIYNLNPRDNELMATMIGNFQDGSVAGKIQFGSGWWFLDQKDGMTKQMNALSSLGLLSRFVGMLTDSRSFLSYPRHEYFRRILCNLIGTDVENGEIPNDMGLLSEMIKNISFNNAKDYFGIEL